jgi:hypothetical protein
MKSFYYFKVKKLKSVLDFALKIKVLMRLVQHHFMNPG